MTEENNVRVGHVRKDDFDVYAGRKVFGGEARHLLNRKPGAPGWLGNPFRVENHGRSEAIRQYARFFRMKLAMDADFRDAVRDLEGKTLGCWCRSVEDDEPACHCDVIASTVNDGRIPPDEPPAASVVCTECGVVRRFEQGDEWHDPEGRARLAVADHDAHLAHGRLQVRIEGD